MYENAKCNTKQSNTTVWIMCLNETAMNFDRGIRASRIMILHMLEDQ